MKRTILFCIMALATLSCFCEDEKKENSRPVIYNESPKKSPRRKGVDFNEKDGYAIFRFNQNYSNVRIVLHFDEQTQLLDEMEEINSGQQFAYYIAEDVRTIYVYSGSSIVFTRTR